jgi:hypothetical protein
MRRLSLIIAIVVVGLGLIGFIIWFVILRDTGSAAVLNGEQSAPTEQLPSSDTAPAANSGTAVAEVAPVVETPAPYVEERETVTALAKSFAERYGSYSSTSNFANVEDSLALMTEGFAATSRAQVQAGRSTSTTPTGPTITTISRALSATLSAFDAPSGTASVAVSMQVQELTGAEAKGTVSYRTMALTMAKVDGTWKVDSAKWQAK